MPNSNVTTSNTTFIQEVREFVLRNLKDIETDLDVDIERIVNAIVSLLEHNKAEQSNTSIGSSNVTI
jgi:hypothetical protein